MHIAAYMLLLAVSSVVSIRLLPASEMLFKFYLNHVNIVLPMSICLETAFASYAKTGLPLLHSTLIWITGINWEFGSYATYTSNVWMPRLHICICKLRGCYFSTWCHWYSYRDSWTTVQSDLAACCANYRAGGGGGIEIFHSIKKGLSVDFLSRPIYTNITRMFNMMTSIWSKT